MEVQIPTEKQIEMEAEDEDERLDHEKNPMKIVENERVELEKNEQEEAKMNELKNEQIKEVEDTEKMNEPENDQHQIEKNEQVEEIDKSDFTEKMNEPGEVNKNEQRQVEENEQVEEIEKSECTEKMNEPGDEQVEVNKNEQLKNEQNEQKIEINKVECPEKMNEIENEQVKIKNEQLEIQSQKSEPGSPEMENFFHNNVKIEDLEETNPFKDDLNQSMDNLNLLKPDPNSSMMMMQRCKSESDLLAPQKPPRIFAKNKKKPISSIRSKSPYDKYKARSMMPSVEEYPEDLNPFGDDEEDEPVKVQPEPSKPVISPQSSIGEYPDDKNPFGEDEDDVFVELPKLRKPIQVDHPKPFKRRPSRKSYRAPQPPKGVRPFSIIVQEEKRIF